MAADPNALNNAMLGFSETMKPINDFLDGQREDMKRRGYSDDTAQRIVVDLHAHILWLMRGARS